MQPVGNGIYRGNDGRYAIIRKTREGFEVWEAVARSPRKVQRTELLMTFKGFPAAKAWTTRYLETP